MESLLLVRKSCSNSSKIEEVLLFVETEDDEECLVKMADRRCSAIASIHKAKTRGQVKSDIGVGCYIERGEQVSTQVYQSSVSFW